MQVRAAQATDREAVVSLWERAGLTRPWNDPRSDFDLALAAPNSAVLMCEDAGALAASVMVGFDGHRGWIYYLAVDGERRRSGLGRRMMAEAEAWLRERGAPKLQLMVRDDNEEALGFYAALDLERQGVVVLGRRLDGR